MISSKKILITGAAGFIGRQLSDKLIKKNLDVVQVDDLSQKPLISPHENLIVDSVQNISKDLLNEKSIDTIVHLAAKKNVKDSFYNLDNSVENYEMTLKLYNACNNSSVKKIFLASTCEIFGFQEGTLKEDSPFLPHSPYAVSKVANEYLSDMYMMLNNSLKITSLNFFNTYGPTEGIDAVIPNFISKIFNNETIKIEGDGEQARDFTFIDDTVNLLIQIITSNQYYRSINIGSGKDVSVNSIVNILERHLPNIKYEHKKKRPNEIKTFIADNTLIKKEYSFRPLIPIEDGIKKVIDFYKK